MFLTPSNNFTNEILRPLDANNIRQYLQLSEHFRKSVYVRPEFKLTKCINQKWRTVPRRELRSLLHSVATWDRFTRSETTWKF